MRRALAIAAVLCAGAAAAASAQARDTALVSAESVAREWIGWLDAGELEQAWVVVAPAMRGTIGFEEWATSLRSLRSVLPPAAPRTLARAEHGVPLFGGSSVWLTFHVGTKPYREIVVLVRSGGGWRVAGYGVLL